MISAKALKSWLSVLPADVGVAIDEGGLTLVAIDEDGKETGAYLDIGGKPEEFEH